MSINEQLPLLQYVRLCAADPRAIARCGSPPPTLLIFFFSALIVVAFFS